MCSCSTGDVLISYENEAINIQRQGKPVEHINSAADLQDRQPGRVVATTTHLDQATALKNFLFTPEGQKIWAQAGFRPVDPAVAAEFGRPTSRAPAKLWTIADLGGWETVDAALFDKENGAITTIYRKATG